MTKRMAAAAGTAGEMAIDGRNVAVSAPLTLTTRTTVVLPVALDQNLELFAVKTGVSKGDVIKRVLTEYLTKQGFQPDKSPKSISIAY